MRARTSLRSFTEYFQDCGGSEGSELRLGGPLIGSRLPVPIPPADPRLTPNRKSTPVCYFVGVALQRTPPLFVGCASGKKQDALSGSCNIVFTLFLSGLS